MLSFIADFAEEAEFTLSKAGQLKLTYNEFSYYKHSNFAGKTFWRCDKYKIYKCRAKAYTIKAGAREMVKTIGLHTHNQEFY